MKALILRQVTDTAQNPAPLELVEIPVPVPGENEIRINVTVCGVCHTELDEIEGRTPPSVFPMIPGHQVVGRVAEKGPGAHRFRIGDRVGVAWIFSTCGACGHCINGEENLCPDFQATGRDAPGGYAESMTVKEDFVFQIPDVFSDAEAAPLLCAGAIGMRSLRLSGIRNGQRMGLTGFGASAHLVIQTVRHGYPGTRIYVFARSAAEREFALTLGAAWAGDTTETPPEKLDAVIDTTPAWKPVVEALKHLKPGGRLVVNAIRKEEVDKKELLGLDYPEHLWLEKEIKSVANVARKDVSDFLRVAAEIPIKPHIQEFPLERANEALLELKQRKARGAKVLRIRHPDKE
ncbi:MAG: zinc-dependent alcohol dehydrogenase family protein [Deltaproteobacteria bacterium]|nr:zinc-dependent alcohol dehydrogenase family protein [Deltaproteobacteria bacterium]